MFSLSKMCQNTLKNPRGVVEVGAQMKYLKRTQSVGIFISNEKFSRTRVLVLEVKIHKGQSLFRGAAPQSCGSQDIRPWLGNRTSG